MTTTLKQVEMHLYGSSRLGICNELTVAPNKVTVEPGYGDAQNRGILSTFTRGEKVPELSNHLGNIQTTVSDKLLAVGTGTAVDYYLSDVVSTTDYTPFGMAMVGRNYSSAKYRYKFNGKEKDTDIGEDDYDYGMRIHDARLGRFLSIDPITKKYPELTPYQFASNSPIVGIDLDGLEFRKYDEKFNSIIVYPRDEVKDDAIIKKQYEYAMKANMNVLIASSISETNKFLGEKTSSSKICFLQVIIILTLLH